VTGNSTPSVSASSGMARMSFRKASRSTVPTIFSPFIAAATKPWRIFMTAGPPEVSEKSSAPVKS
jgi:hypothetical protein